MKYPKIFEGSGVGPGRIRGSRIELFDAVLPQVAPTVSRFRLLWVG